jgi:hypothetical protein
VLNENSLSVCRLRNVPERRLTSGPTLGTWQVTQAMKRRHYSGICKLSTSECDKGCMSRDQPLMDHRCCAILLNCLSTSTTTTTCSFHMAEVRCLRLLWQKVALLSWAWGKALITIHNTCLLHGLLFKMKKILCELFLMENQRDLLLTLKSRHIPESNHATWLVKRLMYTNA